MNIILLIVGIFVMLTGILIWKRQLVGAIAGYDPKKTKDKRGLARWIGTNLLWMGLGMTAAGAVGLLCPGIAFGWIAGVWIASVLGFSIRAALGSKRFEEKQ